MLRPAPWALPAAAGVVWAALLAASPTAGLLVVAAAVGLTLAATTPAVWAVLIGLVLWNTQQLGGFLVSNLALGVVALMGASIAYLRPSGLGRALLPFVAYLVSLLPGTLANPSGAGLVAVLVQRPLVSIGAVLAGAWIGGRKNGARAFLTTLCVASALAALAALPAIPTGLPATPLGLNKNYAGPCFVAVALLRIVPGSLPVPKALRAPHVVLLLLGMLATQSRSAVLGLLVAVLYLVLRRGGATVLVRLGILVGFVVGVGLVVSLVQEQLASDNAFNSAATRPADAVALVGIFRAHPVLGLGAAQIFSVRTASAYGAVTAPAMSLQSLAEGGLVGALGLVAVVVLPFRLDLGGATTTFRALWLARLVEGQFDFFWVGGPTVLTIVLLGVCLTGRRERPTTAPTAVATGPPDRVLVPA